MFLEQNEYARCAFEFELAHSNDIDEILAFLRPLSQYYPELDVWFINRVIPGLEDGSRRIFTVKDEGQLVGLGIGKKTTFEAKVCTLCVNRSYTGRGIGAYLMQNLMGWLNTAHPVITVAEEKVTEFRQLFAKFGFVLTSTNNGLYRKGKIEYIYNEPSGLQVFKN